MQNRLKEFRENAMIDRSEFARRCGITRQALINIEEGRSVPRVDLCLRLVAVLNDVFHTLYGLHVTIENVFCHGKNPESLIIWNELAKSTLEEV